MGLTVGVFLALFFSFGLFLLGRPAGADGSGNPKALAAQINQLKSRKASLEAEIAQRSATMSADIEEERARLMAEMRTKIEAAKAPQSSPALDPIETNVDTASIRRELAQPLADELEALQCQIDELSDLQAPASRAVLKNELRRLIENLRSGY